MSNVYGLMADVHLHAWSSFSTTLPDGMNSRLSALLGEIKRCTQETIAAGGMKVVIAGDVFHVRGSVAPSVLNPTIDLLRHLGESYGVEFVILAGNHDLEGKEASRIGSAITALECKYVRVCNQVHIDTDIGAMLVPWVENIESLKEEIVALTRLDAHDHTEFDLIIHAPVNGVIKGLPESGLDPEWLASLGFKRVASGHYHNHKSFHDGKVHSIGALAHHTWSDVGSKAGFLLVSKTDVVWRKSHLPEFIDLSKIEDLSEDEIPLLVDRNYVRIRVESSKLSEIEAAKTELREHGAAAVLVQAMPKPPARESGVATSVKSSGSLEESIAAFASTITSVPKEALNKEVMDIYAKVSSGALV